MQQGNVPDNHNNEKQDSPFDDLELEAILPDPLHSPYNEQQMETNHSFKIDNHQELPAAENPICEYQCTRVLTQDKSHVPTQPTMISQHCDNNHQASEQEQEPISSIPSHSIDFISSAKIPNCHPKKDLSRDATSKSKETLEPQQKSSQEHGKSAVESPIADICSPSKKFQDKFVQNIVEYTFSEATVSKRKVLKESVVNDAGKSQEILRHQESCSEAQTRSNQITPLFDSSGSFTGANIDEKIIEGKSRFCVLSGIRVKFCIISLPKFIDCIRIPKRKCRADNAHHIENLKKSMMENQLISTGLLSATIDYGNESIGFLLIDGVHRFMALRELYKEGLISVDATLPVVLYAPRAEENIWMPLTPSQRIALGMELNFVEANRRNMSNLDIYHTIQSFIITEIGTTGKAALIGGMRSAVLRAIQLRLLRRLPTNNYGEVLTNEEECGEIAEHQVRKLEAPYREWFRAAVGFMSCPVSAEIALIDPTIAQLDLSPRFWSRRTFALKSFACASDDLKVIFLCLLARKSSKGYIERKHVSLFLDFVMRLYSCTRSRSENPVIILATNHRLKSGSTTVLVMELFSLFADVWVHPDEQERYSEDADALARNETSYLKVFRDVIKTVSVKLNDKSTTNIRHVLRNVLTSNIRDKNTLTLDDIGNWTNGQNMPATATLERRVEVSYPNLFRGTTNAKERRKASMKAKSSMTESTAKYYSASSKRRRKSSRTSSGTRATGKKRKYGTESCSDEEHSAIEKSLVKLIKESFPSNKNATNLPSFCENGIWEHFVSTEEISVMKQDLMISLHKIVQDLFPDLPRYDNCSQSYFTAIALLRNRMDQKGYIVVPNVFWNSFAMSWIRDVLKHFESRFSGENGPSGDENSDPWSQIRNAGDEEDKISALKGIGRYYINMAECLNEMIDSDSDVFRKKCYMEIYLALFADDIINDRDCEHPLHFPSLGSKLLLTTDSASRQNCHFDFEINKFASTEPCELWRPARQVSYFSMISGETGFPLWIWDRAHTFQTGPKHLTEEILKTLRGQKIFIPPYSFLLVRGDIPHAGGGGSDDDERVRGCPPRGRVHTYITRTCQSARGDQVGAEREDIIYEANKMLYKFAEDEVEPECPTNKVALELDEESIDNDNENTQPQSSQEGNAVNLENSQIEPTVENELCAMQSQCKFDGKHANHTCSTCKKRNVHNLCEYGKLVMKRFDREEVFACSRSCFQNEQQGKQI